MAQLKPVQIHGSLKDINDNFAAIAPIAAFTGIGNLRVAVAEFNVAKKDSAGANNTTVAAHGTGVKIPANAIVFGGFMEVLDPITGVGASVAVHVKAANDIQTAAAISGAPWSTKGLKAITPKINTPESTGIKTTAESEITFTVTGAVLTAGRVVVYLPFVEGLAPAA
jgi:hypothetical protein